MVKNIVLIGSSSELALEFIDIVSKDTAYKIHKISSKEASDPDLHTNDYLDDVNKITDYISELKSPYVIFFNGYLRENRPKYYPENEEIFKTFRVNFKIPLYLSKQIKNSTDNPKFIFISTMAAIKLREKNYIYGSAKASLERNIKEEGLDFLFLRFGKIMTEMSSDHNDPPFTLSKSEAAILIRKLIDRKGVIYPTTGLKVMGFIITLLPSKILDFIEKKV
jgi:hypothetical protein